MSIATVRHVPGGRKTRRASEHREAARALGAFLRRSREAQGLSRDELAIQSGSSVSTIQKIEVGTVVEPGYFTVVALCRALGLGMADLDMLGDT